MNKIISILSIASIAITACNNPTTTEQTSTVNNTDTSVNLKEGSHSVLPNQSCYATVSGKDSVTLKLFATNKKVNGNLHYKNYEKDSNKGTIEGMMLGDTLIADYTFMSEGVQSIRQIAFLIKDNMAVEGYTDIEEKDGKTIFKNRGKLKFGEGISMNKVECDN